MKWTKLRAVGHLEETMKEYSPRAAVLLLTDALGHLDLIQPPAAREPVRQMLRAGIETCAVSRSLLGQPVVYTIELAEALIEAAR